MESVCCECKEPETEENGVVLIRQAEIVICEDCRAKRDSIGIDEFMALPDHKKKCYFVRTYPNADGSREDYHDHDIGVYRKELLLNPNLQCECCQKKDYGKYIGTDDSCHEPVFCEKCYRKINSDVEGGYCGRPSEFYLHAFKCVLPVSPYDQGVEDITKIIDDSTESDIDGGMFFNTDVRSIAREILDSLKITPLPRVVVQVSGGIIDLVEATEGISVELRDYDLEGCSDEELAKTNKVVYGKGGRYIIK